MGWVHDGAGSGLGGRRTDSGAKDARDHIDALLVAGRRDDHTARRNLGLDRCMESRDRMRAVSAGWQQPSDSIQHKMAGSYQRAEIGLQRSDSRRARELHEDVHTVLADVQGRLRELELKRERPNGHRV